MRSPRRCLLVVIGCYILVTIISMVTDVFFEPTHLVQSSKGRLPDMFISIQADDKVGAENIRMTYNVSKEKPKQRPVQPISILTKYATYNVLGNVSAETNATLDINRRLLLRTDLKKRKIVHLHYEPFHVTEPFFGSSEDKQMFYKNKINTGDVGLVPDERLQGTIAWIPNATISRSQDCGWKTPLEKFQVNTGGVSKEYHDILCPLLIPDGNAFQHFIDGGLPKLMQAYEYIIQNDVKLLIYAPRDSIILEMIMALGFKRSQIIYYQGGTVFADVMINTCLTPPLHPDLWQTARRMVGAPEYPIVHPGDASVILLTRAKQHNPGRKMTNTDDVFQFLSHRYGNNSVLFKGGYSLVESIGLFGKAKIIIGVHGGAFYNMLYAPKGTNIVEIMPTDSDGNIAKGLAHTIVWHMAGLLEQPYWRIIEKPLKPLSKSNDVQLSIAKLKTILDQIDASFQPHSG